MQLLFLPILPLADIPTPDAVAEPSAPLLAFGDFDGDGLADLAVSDGRGIELLRNVGRGPFEDVTAASGVVGNALDLSWQDVDGDGRLDLHVVRMDGTNSLYRNLGGAKFEDATVASGLERAGVCKRVVWFDYDGDGRSDLAVWRAGGVELLHNERGVLQRTELVWNGVHAPNSSSGASAKAAGGSSESTWDETPLVAAANVAAPRSSTPARRGADSSETTRGRTESRGAADERAIGGALAASATPGSSPGLATAVCTPSLQDQALPGNCIGVSSVPELGALFPISPELFVAPNGDVGLGTLTPHGELHVQADATTTLRLDTVNSNGTSRIQLLEDDLQPFASGAELTYDGANDRLQISTITGVLTTPRIVVERSTANEVGLNVVDPQASLHVVGGPTLGSLLVAPNEAVGGKDSQLVLGEDDDATAGMKLIYRGGSDRLDFRGLDNGVETPLVTFERSGDVGIGTNSPANPLHVAGTAATMTKIESNHSTSTRVEIANTDVGGRAYDLNSTGSAHGSGAGKFIVRDVAAGANRMTIDSTGKLGIGTSSPTERLHVAGNIRVNDNSDVFGLDELVGFDNLRLSGDAGGGPDIVIEPNGEIELGGDFTISPFGSVYVGPNTGGISCNFFEIEAPSGCLWDILRVEDFGGASVLSVESADQVTGDDARVLVTGDFSVANGSKNFVLDHPLDPANSELAHNAVEGPGYYTFYRGNVVLDACGEATVELPAYFDALNADPSYQLTCVGGHAPVYVASESTNGFRIAGGTPGLKVSWQVTAERDDPYARDNPYHAERSKSADERGRFHYPQGFGAAPEQALARQPQTSGPAAPAAPATVAASTRR
ncbi:MAG: VCBS repeat-containing protein [Planctomycetes bacterium]|nr:VCBS repeat-containing protein [Planctomycetota bacterium]